jgi:hypothetical protein
VGGETQPVPAEVAGSIQHGQENIVPESIAPLPTATPSASQPPSPQLAPAASADIEREIKDAANAKTKAWRKAQVQEDPHGFISVAKEAEVRRVLEQVEAAEHGLAHGDAAVVSQPDAQAVDFFTSNTAARPEIIAGIIREAQFAVLAGTYGVGKSPLLSHIAVCTLNGKAWCGRTVCRRPVIAFDFESSGPAFKRDYANTAKRLAVDLPRVPDELEAYVEHDSADMPATAQLLEVVKEKNLGKAVDFLESAVERKPNALVLIDPLELLFRIDTRDKKHVLWLYSRLRHLLARYPQAAILFTLNLRKKDRRAATQPDLLTDPRGWLEDVSGSLDILNRCDVRLGLDFYSEDIRVINGVRRGEDMHPVLIRPVGELPDRLAGFEPCPPTNLTLTFSFTAAQLKYWEGLPSEFRFEDVADKSVPRATLYRLLKKAESLTIVEERDGIWRKKQFGSPIC